MTARQLYEYALIEINKYEAPSLLLEDYNYFINKAIQQYINKVYNRYDVNQQSTDDLRVLRITSTLELTKSENAISNIYVTSLPKNYFHLLNCIVEYTILKTTSCLEKDSKIYFGARRLTSDMFPQIINNAYMKPTYKRPYYYINTSILDNSNESNILLEIRCGKSDLIYNPTKVTVDYIKSPMFVRLTQQQIDEVEDKSQILEFPDYVCFEIVNEFTKLLLENGGDPRLQTNIPINQSIAMPNGSAK